jgi:hypothetical protein
MNSLKTLVAAAASVVTLGFIGAQGAAAQMMQHTPNVMNHNGNNMNHQTPTDRTRIIDRKVVEKKTTIVDRRGPVVEKNTTIVDRRGPVIEKKTVIVDHRAPVIEKKTVIVDHRAPVIDRKVVVVDRRPVLFASAPVVIPATTKKVCTAEVWGQTRNFELTEWGRTGDACQAVTPRGFTVTGVITRVPA